MSSCHLLVRLDGILYGEDADVCDCVRVGIGCPVSSLVQWSAFLGVYELSKYRRAELLGQQSDRTFVPPPKKTSAPATWPFRKPPSGISAPGYGYGLGLRLGPWG